MKLTKDRFMDLLTDFKNLFFSFALKLTRNQADAKDLYQESLLKAYANKDKYSVGTNFKAWVTTIMRNSFINEYRKRRTRNKIEQPVEENIDAVINTSVRNRGDRAILLDELRQMVDSLKEKHRKPFRMFFEGYEYKEISRKLGLPMGTVKSRIYFARKKLREMIRNRYQEIPLPV